MRTRSRRGSIARHEAGVSRISAPRRSTMSYRDDHDAALARIDALEEELALLQNQQQPPPEAPATRRWTKGMLSLTGILFAIAALCIGIARYGSPLQKPVA